jgi:hypothetical protein
LCVADGREEALEDVPAGVELELGRVVVVGGPHRAHHRQAVHAAGQVRPPVADLDAALALLPEADLQRIQLAQQRPRRAGEVADVLAIIGRFDNRLAKGRGIDGLAGVPVEGRLGIEGLDVADAALHEQPHDALRPRDEVRLSRAVSAGDAVLVQHGAKGQAGETHADVGQESAAADAATAVGGGGRMVHGPALSGW